MANKVNWFEADKTMSARVAEFIRCKGEFITLKAQRKAEIDGLQARLARYNDPDRVIVEDAAKRAAYIASVEKELEDVKATYAALIAENATFEYTAGDKALYAAYKSGDLENGIVNWVKAYAKDGKTLDISGTVDLDEVMNDLGGRRAVTARKHVNSGGTVFLGERTRDDVLKTFYGSMAERMIKAGTLKPHQFPEEIRAKYAPKARAKKADK